MGGIVLFEAFEGWPLGVECTFAVTGVSTTDRPPESPGLFSPVSPPQSAFFRLSRDHFHAGTGHDITSLPERCVYARIGDSVVDSH